MNTTSAVMCRLSRGAKYTRARRPVTIAYREEATNRSEAQQREAQIKRLSATQKEALITTTPITAN